MMRHLVGRNILVATFAGRCSGLLRRVGWFHIEIEDSDGDIWHVKRGAVITCVHGSAFDASREKMVELKARMDELKAKINEDPRRPALSPDEISSLMNGDGEKM